MTSRTVLYFENPKRWCVVVPQELQQELTMDAHGGCFSGHLSEKKAYMIGCVNMHGGREHCQGCHSVCEQAWTWKEIETSTTPAIPVGGPFQQVAVDVLQLPPIQSVVISM